MTYYMKSGTSFRQTDEANVQLHTALPAGNYIVKVDQFGAYYYEQVDNFKTISKRYGDNERQNRRIIDTFLNRENSTGVMLAGEKGSGKSLLAKTISITLAEELDVPTIIINKDYCGDDFNAFIQGMDQPAVILFDEFEKVYDREKQELLLTLLDGVFPTKKLFVLTCNNKYRIDEHMRNRPGRIFYMIDFNGLSEDFIIEYCNDNLNDKSHIEQICRIAGVFSQFNFDMLKALVEEMNRYGESPNEALRYLNVKAEFGGSCHYEVELYVDGKKVTDEELDTKSWNGNPLSEDIEIYYNDGDEGYSRTNIDKDNLESVSDRGKKFVFSDDDVKVVLTRVEANNVRNFYDLL